MHYPMKKYSCDFGIFMPKHLAGQWLLNSYKYSQSTGKTKIRIHDLWKLSHVALLIENNRSFVVIGKDEVMKKSHCAFWKSGILYIICVSQDLTKCGKSSVSAAF